MKKHFDRRIMRGYQDLDEATEAANGYAEDYRHLQELTAGIPDIDQLTAFVPMARRVVALSKQNCAGWEKMCDGERIKVCEYLMHACQDVDFLQLIIKHGGCDTATATALELAHRNALDAIGAEDIPF